MLSFNRSCTFIWCSCRWLWASKWSLSRWIIERKLFWTISLTLAHLHTSISPPELFTFNWLVIPNLDFFFTKSTSGVVLNLVKMKNRTAGSGHNCYTNINFTFFRVFSANIFNPPKPLDTTLDDVAISHKLTSPSK